MTFSYTENGTGARKTLTLDALEFVRRVLSHVLPAGLHKVRYFGWLHPNARQRLRRVQTLLAVLLILTPPAPADPPRHLRCPAWLAHFPAPACPARRRLGGAFALQIVGRLPRARAP